MTVEEKSRIIESFRKTCIACWTSEEYQSPADSKEVAEFKAMEVCLLLGQVLD